MSISSIINRSKTSKKVNYLFTFGSEFIILFIGILLFKIIAPKFGIEEFAEYALSKRFYGFMIPLLMVGMGVSLPKFLSVSSDVEQKEIYYTSILLVTALSLVALIIVLIQLSFFSLLIFGNPNQGKLLVYLIFYLFSLLTHACVYNYFRGKLDFLVSSSIQLVNLGLLPLLVFFFTSSIENYFLTLAVVTTLFLLTISLLKIPTIQLTKNLLKKNSNKLLVYGLQRTPGDVVLGLFFAIPTFFIANYFSLIQAGNVAFCLSLFNMVIAVVSPINIILLPKASQIINEGDFVKLKEIGKKLLILSVSLGILALIGTLLLGKWVLKLFSISNVEETTSFLFIIFSAVIGYSIFSIIRSIIDAYYKTARVGLIILVAFVVFLISVALFYASGNFSVETILYSLSISVNLLGVLCLVHLVRINKNHLQ